MDSTPGREVYCDTDRLCHVINELRTIAETVRTYRFGAPELARLPAELHLAATTLETDMRELMHREHYKAKVITYGRESAAVEAFFRPAETITADPPVIEAFPILANPPTTTAPTTSSGEIRAHELQMAAQRLRTVVSTTLPAAFRSPQADTVSTILSAILDDLDRYL